MIQFKENTRTDRWKHGQKDRQILFYRTLPATAGGPKSKLSLVLQFHGINKLICCA